MITIIGTAHVFNISDRVKEEIMLRNPSVVAVELDRQRFAALKSGNKNKKNTPLIYRAMGFLQKKIAKDYGVQVGQEMLTAVETAQELGAGVAFIDLPANMMFKKMMNAMSLKEKLYFIIGLVAGLFTSKKRVEKEMEKYQKNESDYMKILEKNMPSISRVLIDERNEYMAKNLKELETRFGSVVAVVGDGHVSGLVKEINAEKLDLVRLKDLREKKSNNEINYSYSINMQ